MPSKLPKVVKELPKSVVKGWEYCSSQSWEAYHKGDVVYLGNRSSRSKGWIKESKKNLGDYDNLPSCIK